MVGTLDSTASNSKQINIFKVSVIMSSPVLDGIRSSAKGNLIYDKYWLEDGRLEEVIEHCSSPPQISADLLVAAFTKINLSSASPGQGQGDRSNSDDKKDSGSNVSHDDSHAKRRSIKLQETSLSQGHESSHVERALIQVEQEWEDIVKDRVKEKLWQIEERSRQIQEQAAQNMALLGQQRELRQRAALQLMRQTQREMEEKREQRLMQQQEIHRLHLKRLDDKMKAAVLQREAEESEKRKRERERLAFVGNLQRIKSQVDESANRILQSLAACQHKEHLSPEASKIQEGVRELCEEAGSTVREAKKAESFSDLERTMQRVVERLMQRQEETIKALADAERSFREDAARKEKERVRLEQEKAKQAELATAQPAQPQQPQPQQPRPTKAIALESSVSAEALTEYTSQEEKHKALADSFKGLSKTTDKDVKKYRFDLQKAVNTPINSVSVQSGSHLLGKLKKLKDLLAGREVDMAARRVMATKPTGIAYCKDLAAKKLVKQGDEQISANHESAFAFAAIAVALWQEIPDMGDLFLYHFYHSCPFLVPYHISKQEAQSLEDYYKALGYVYDSEGQVEKQDKYLRRMSGFTRLYAAIIATPPLRGQAHPHGVERGWTFLARVMNLEPQPDITATTLYDFLDVCGQALANAYGRQFFKLLQTLSREYFPKIEAVTPQGSGGPVTRLKGFLEDCLKKQRIPQPKGYLSSDFWRS